MPEFSLPTPAIESARSVPVDFATAAPNGRAFLAGGGSRGSWTDFGGGILMGAVGIDLEGGTLAGGGVSKGEGTPMAAA